MKIKFKPKPRKEPKLALETFRLRNFKAVRDSGEIEFTPLTVFIGNNGSGKSSLLEALETLWRVIEFGLDDAFIPWKGFENIWNKAVKHDPTENQLGRLSLANPMMFEISGLMDAIPFKGKIEINKDKSRDQILITSQDFETFRQVPPEENKAADKPDFEVHYHAWGDFVKSWQFLNLEPSQMLQPRPQRRSVRQIGLKKKGANIAQFLQSIYDIEPSVLESIAETLKSVMPYASDLRPAITSELERNVYLKLSEAGIEEPLGGWLLSQGTLRIVALLAVLRHPKPFSVIFIEELENGLDPRAIHLIVDEIRTYLQAGGQIVATTHSPYLLDLLELSQIVVVERSQSGAPTFKRPSKQKLKAWSDKFAPGRLYTMGNLTES
jgi:predicted ATPase